MSEREGVQARGGAAPTRCPYCHEDCASDPDVALCGACVARHHRDCWRALGRCGACKHGSAFGDPGSRAAVAPPAPAALARERPGTILGVLLVSALLIIGATAYAIRSIEPRPLRLIVGPPTSREGVVEVTGSVVRPVPEGTRVLVQGLPVVVDDGGLFSASLRLPEGAHEIEVTARGEAQACREVRSVVVDLSPRVRLDSPPDGQGVQSSSIRVSGHVDDSSEWVDIGVVGHPFVRVKPGPFELEVPLRPGVNALRIASRDVFGNFGADRLVLVIYEPPR